MCSSTLQSQKAHKALKEAYPDVVKEEVLDWSLIKSALNTCHLVKDNKSQDQLEWFTFNEVEQKQAVAKPVIVKKSSQKGLFELPVIEIALTV